MSRLSLCHSIAGYQSHKYRNRFDLIPLFSKYGLYAMMTDSNMSLMFLKQCKRKRFCWYNEQRVLENTERNALISGHQRKMTKIIKSLRLGRVTEVVTNAFRSSPIYIV